MRYRVVCEKQVPAGLANTHGHIVEVTTGTTPQHYDRLSSVAEVIAANGQGDVFCTNRLDAMGCQINVIGVSKSIRHYPACARLGLGRRQA